MPINPSAAGRVRRGKGEGDTPWSNIIAFPPSSKDLCSLFFFFSFSFFLFFPIGRSVELGGRDPMECIHRWQQERLARSKVCQRSVSRVRLVEHGVLYVFRGDAFNYLSGCWNLYAVPVLFEAKEKRWNHRDFSLSSLLPFASIQETLLSLPCLFFHSLGLFDRCYLSTRKENEYAFSRKRVLEILMYATRRKGQEKVVSSIFNYIEPS